MPKNKVTDPITDQEMAFARQVLSGAMTDRQAAEAVGLNPDSAAYMLDHRAAVEQQLVQQETDGLRRLKLDREQVLDRLWEIANLSPEMTRGSITGQVKAISMIVAMENFIPDRRAVSWQKKSDPEPTQPQIYPAAWPARQQATTIDPQPSPAPGKPAPGSAAEPPPDPVPSQSTSANRSTRAEAPLPYVPLFNSVPDLGVPLPIKNPFVRPR
jgi:hypothetical protein